jgi:alpha-L-fucosidase
MTRRTNYRRRALILPLLLILFRTLPGNCQTQAETYIWPTDVKVMNSLKQWQGDKFGILIHMGLYSQLGIVESWALCPEDWCDRPGDDYYTFAADYRNTINRLNPVQFNPEKWASAIKGSGAKYVIFTMKHHDGFCMYDTKFTDFKITSKTSPFSSNPNANIGREVLNACREEGLKVGAYFSKPDWSSPDFWWPYYPPKDRNPNYDITKHPDRWKRFIEYTQNQLEEITSDLGKIDILWLDGCWVMPKSSINSHVAEFCKYPYDLSIDMPLIAARARQKQPGLIVVDRWVQGPFEDYLTPEQKTPDKALTVPWESCITLGNAWGWVPNDNYKSSREVIQLLVQVVSKGGNLLLGIGPDGTGEFDPSVYQRLEEIGKWLNVNGEAIYSTHVVAPFQEGKISYTAKGSDTLYAIYLPGKDEFQLPEKLLIKTTLKGGFLCTTPGNTQPISCTPTADGVALFLSPQLQEELAKKAAAVFRIVVR